MPRLTILRKVPGSSPRPSAIDGAFIVVRSFERRQLRSLFFARQIPATLICVSNSLVPFLISFFWVGASFHPLSPLRPVPFFGDVLLQLFLPRYGRVLAGQDPPGVESFLGAAAPRFLFLPFCRARPDLCVSCESGPLFKRGGRPVCACFLAADCRLLPFPPGC